MLTETAVVNGSPETGAGKILRRISTSCLVPVVVRNLSLCPQMIPVLAGWHHQCWQGIGTDIPLQSRISRLERHLPDDLLPSTWVSFENQKPCGSISLVSYGSHCNPLTNAWVANLYVCTDRRNQGIGTALLEYVLSQAGVIGLERLYLFTAEHKSFYQRRRWQWCRSQYVQGQWVDILRHSLNE